MARRRRKRHALLARDGASDDGPEDPSNPDARDAPFLPEVGAVYQVNTLIYASHDPAPERPAVVVAVPAVAHGRIQIVTRTSATIGGGVTHPPDPSLGLDLEGCFVGLNSVEQQLWTVANVRYLGLLPNPYLSAILEKQ